MQICADRKEKQPRRSNAHTPPAVQTPPDAGGRHRRSRSMRLRIRLPSGQQTCDCETFGELSAQVTAALNGDENWKLLFGYPPQPIDDDARSSMSLESMGLRAGETVMVKLGEKVGAPAPVPTPAAAATPAPAAAVSDSRMDQEAEDMKLALALSMGEVPSPPAIGGATGGAAGGATGGSGGGEEKLVRRVIPADNSCLFAAIAHAFEGAEGRRKRADELRRVVADAVLADPDEYSEAVLGKPPAEYVKWIRDSAHWGGGIEIAVLARHFGMEIAAFDIQTQRVDVFGQGCGYTSRAYLLYDGIHYDLIVRQLFPGAPETLDVSVFAADDHAPEMVEASALVAEAHKARKFTDTAKFTLRCLVCQKGLIGEEGARAHAKETGHMNFSEY